MISDQRKDDGRVASAAKRVEQAKGATLRNGSQRHASGQPGLRERRYLYRLMLKSEAPA